MGCEARPDAEDKHLEIDSQLDGLAGQQHALIRITEAYKGINPAAKGSVLFVPVFLDDEKAFFGARTIGDSALGPRPKWTH